MSILDRFRSHDPEPRIVEDVSSLPDMGGYGVGLVNPITGAGTGLDKRQSFYYQDRSWTQQELDTIAEVSWAAGKIITIVVDDIFNRWRTWEDRADEMLEYEREMKVRKRMRELMLSARRYGTAFAVMMLRDDEMSEPLDVDMVQPDDLTNVVITDHYNISVTRFQTEDPWAPDFGEPEMYLINFPGGGRILDVHPTRVLRLDGIERPMRTRIESSPGSWNQWGLSVIPPVIDAIIAEDATAGAAAHLVQEASVKILKTGDHQAAAVAGGKGRVAKFRESINRMIQYKSVFRLMLLPYNSSYERQNYNFAGLKDLLDRQVARVAAAADIPNSRFSSRSSANLNANGESDDINYARKIAGEQEKLDEVLRRFDDIAMRSYGISDPPAYHFPSILEQSEGAIVDAERKKSEALARARQEGFITETEGRMALSGSSVFGTLEGEAPGYPGEMSETGMIPPNTRITAEPDQPNKGPADE